MYLKKDGNYLNLNKYEKEAAEQAFEMFKAVKGLGWVKAVVIEDKTNIVNYEVKFLDIEEMDEVEVEDVSRLG